MTGRKTNRMAVNEIQMDSRKSSKMMHSTNEKFVHSFENVIVVNRCKLSRNWQNPITSL